MFVFSQDFPRVRLFLILVVFWVTFHFQLYLFIGLLGMLDERGEQMWFSLGLVLFILFNGLTKIVYHFFGFFVICF